ncbi:MAG: aldehyde ferredoxin oxidoreductase C-terminal domain-containing protein, partial [Chloroflexota bacterium]
YKTPIETARFNVDCLVPDKDGKPISRKGKVVERDKFDKMMQEYYQLRGWDTDGLPTKTKFQDLGLNDIADDLKKKGLLSKV